MILLHLETKPMPTTVDKTINPLGINPKNYPYRNNLIELISVSGTNGFPLDDIVEIKTAIPLTESMELINKADKIICIDSYLQHLCWYMGKKAVVIFGQSNPDIFGHKENINLLRDVRYLRKHQFDKWELCPYIEKAFVLPEQVIKAIA